MNGFPLVLFKQANHAWGGDVVGEGDKAHDHTMGWIGCLTTTSSILANAMTGSKLTPGEVNKIATAKGCYAPNKAGYKILLNLEKLGPHIGLRMLDRERIRLPLNWKPEAGLVGGLNPTADEVEKMRVARLRLLAGEVLLAGGAVILHVDHNSDKATGDPFGDHFIAGLNRPLADLSILSTIQCSDPAPGAEVILDEKKMDGTSLWNTTPKHYRVVGVAPVWKA